MADQLEELKKARLWKLYKEDRIIILPKKIEKRLKDKIFTLFRGKWGKEEVEKIVWDAPQCVLRDFVLKYVSGYVFFKYDA